MRKTLREFPRTPNIGSLDCREDTLRVTQLSCELACVGSSLAAEGVEKLLNRPQYR